MQKAGGDQLDNEEDQELTIILGKVGGIRTGTKVHCLGRW